MGYRSSTDNNYFKVNMETHYHCSTCDDFDLCIACYEKDGHNHKMVKRGLDLDSGGSSDQQNPQEARRLSIQRCIQSLVHTCLCRDANCRTASCQKMKRVMSHTKVCKRKQTSSCPVCKQLIALCCYHAKHCQETKCPVPFCTAIKQKLQQQLMQQKMQHAKLMRRRMAAMQQTNGMTAVVPDAGPMLMHNAMPSNFIRPNQSDARMNASTAADKPSLSAMFAARQAEQVAQRQAPESNGAVLNTNVQLNAAGMQVNSGVNVNGVLQRSVTPQIKFH